MRSTVTRWVKARDTYAELRAGGGIANDAFTEYTAAFAAARDELRLITQGERANWRDINHDRPRMRAHTGKLVDLRDQAVGKLWATANIGSPEAAALAGALLDVMAGDPPRVMGF